MIRKFKKITKEQIQNSLSYKIATTILNKDDEFTIEEIVIDIKKKLSDDSINNLEIQTLEKLKMMVDNGLLVQHGSYYSNMNRFAK